MLRRSRLLFASLALCAGLSSAGAARAQMVTPNNGGLTDRLDSAGNVITPQERPQNLNPTGVSYSDCIANQRLRFYVELSGFAGQGLQVWAGTTDCSGDTARGRMGTPPVCWQLAGGTPTLNLQAANSQTIDVRVQDLVGPQRAPSPTGNVVAWGSNACQQQPSYAAVGMNVWFVPVNASGYAAGTATSFPVGTDLIGPPAPLVTAGSQSVGDTLFTANWTPNTDPDTVGYDIYIDPTQSQVAARMAEGGTTDGAAEAASSVAGASSGGGITEGGTTITVCDTAQGTADATASEAGDDGSTEASTSAEASVTCHLVVVPSAPPSGSALDAGACGSSVLAQAFLSDGGGTVTVAEDAGEDSGTSTTTVNAYGGGVSTIPTANLVGGANGTTIMTVSSQSVGTYTITGLTDGQTYDVVVSAVDAYGNVGPPSIEVCDFPAPVNDFFQTYRIDGGRAGGGFCTLDAVGMPTGLSGLSLAFGAIGFGLVRRRRKRR